MRTCN